MPNAIFRRRGADLPGRSGGQRPWCRRGVPGIPRPRRPSGLSQLALAGLLLLAAAVPVTAQATTGDLVLEDVLAQVRGRNPRLHAVAAAAEAAAERAPEASTLPDPMIQLGIMNFGIPDLNADMPMSMAPSVQLTQTVPFPGKLGIGIPNALSGRERR